MKNKPLILASSSPRRAALLEQIGVVPDKIIAAQIDETPRRGELPRDLAQRLAREKALAIAKDHPDSFVLAADTVVACGRSILEKAVNKAEELRFLALLSGRRHRVIGGVALACPGGKITCRTIETMVQFKKLGKAEIEDYISSGEWQDKAGGYAIQGRAGAFVKFIGGSYSNVVGLSLYDTMQMLKGAGCVTD